MLHSSTYITLIFLTSSCYNFPTLHIMNGQFCNTYAPRSAPLVPLTAPWDIEPALQTAFPYIRKERPRPSFGFGFGFGTVAPPSTNINANTVSSGFSFGANPTHTSVPSFNSQENGTSTSGLTFGKVSQPFSSNTESGKSEVGISTFSAPFFASDDEENLEGILRCKLS